MKTKFTFLLGLIFVLNSYGQEAGKAGKLIPNELSTSSFDDKNNVLDKTEQGIIDNQSFRPSNRISDFKNENNSQRGRYNYHFNYVGGNSELFLRIPEMGKFTVYVGDQMVSNAVGKYRFFDVQSGNQPVSIYRNNYLVYRTRVNIPHHSRVIMDFFSAYGLYLLDIVPIRMQNYGLGAWDDVWNAPYHSHQNYGNQHYNIGKLMSPARFNQFMQTIKDTPFDDDKMRNIFMVSKNTDFYAKQIAQMIDTFAFDKNQIQLAKKLYIQCIDPENYFLVIDVLKYPSSKKEVQEYILKQ